MKQDLIVAICVAMGLNLVKAQNLDQLRASVTVEEQRAFIKVNVLLDTSPRLVSRQLAISLPDTHMAESTVYNWYNDFKDGRRTDIEDLPRSGRRRTTDEDTKENQTAHNGERGNEDRRFTL